VVLESIITYHTVNPDSDCDDRHTCITSNVILTPNYIQGKYLYEADSMMSNDTQISVSLH